ncbi:MAG: hypothetical protein U0P48_11440 [Ancrocorticia sp.]
MAREHRDHVAGIAIREPTSCRKGARRAHS